MKTDAHVVKITVSADGKLLLQTSCPTTIVASGTINCTSIEGNITAYTTIGSVARINTDAVQIYPLDGETMKKSHPALALNKLLEEFGTAASTSIIAIVDPTTNATPEVNLLERSVKMSCDINGRLICQTKGDAIVISQGDLNAYTLTGAILAYTSSDLTHRPIDYEYQRGYRPEGSQEKVQCKIGDVLPDAWIVGAYVKKEKFIFSVGPDLYNPKDKYTQNSRRIPEITDTKTVFAARDEAIKGGGKKALI